MSDLLTIVVPTGRRPDFLGRWLHYAAEVAFPWLLIIVDDGGEDSIRESRGLIDRYGKKLKLDLIAH